MRRPPIRGEVPTVQETEPRPPVSELHEVEQALSVLDGRHPEFARAQREMRDAAQAQADVRDAKRRKNVRDRLRRGLLVFVGLCLAAVAGRVSTELFVRAQAISAGLNASSARFSTNGFALVASSSLRTPHALDLQVPGPSCFVATTSAASGDLKVQHGAISATGRDSIGWCACGSEHVVVTAPPGASPVEGVRLLSIDPQTIGGREGWATSPVRPEVFAEGGAECQEAALVGWIAQRRFPPLAVDPQWLHEGAHSSLVRVGFSALAGAPAGRRFARVDGGAQSCFVALRTTASADEHPDPLMLEELNGSLVTQGEPLLWCASQPRSFVVRSPGDRPLLVISGAAARIGGVMGTRERLAALGLSEPSTWLAKDDFDWDAANVLRASDLPDVTLGHVTPDARFVSLSTLTVTTLAPPETSVVWCQSPLGPAVRQMTCGQFGTQPWEPTLGETLGLAGAPPPFWLAALSEVHNADALRAQTQLLALARRLAGEGFELTVFEGVTELSPGHISVVGRAHDDAVVAVEVSPEAPWVLPYSDGPPWPSLEQPRVVPLDASARVKLTSTPLPKLPAKNRRTLLFRGTRP